MAQQPLSAEPFIPLLDMMKQLEKNRSAKTTLGILQKIFPGFTEEEANAVVKLEIGIKLPRVNAHLYKPVSWKAPRNNSEGLSADERAAFFDNVLSVVDRMKGTWPLDRLEIIPVPSEALVYDWDRATRLSNFALWGAARQSDVFSAPAVVPTTTARDFSVVVRPVVVNPDNPAQVWAAGDEVVLPDNYASLDEEKQRQVWESLLSNNEEKWMEAFGFDRVRTPFHHPKIALRWNVVSPDGLTTAFEEHGVGAQWTKTATGAAWLKQQDARIAQAYVKAGQWFVLKQLSQVLGGGVDNTDQKIDSLISDLEWNYIGYTQPKTAGDFHAMMAMMKKQDPQGYDTVVQSVLRGAFVVLEQSQSDGLLLVPETRNWFASLPWAVADSSALQSFVEMENAFVKNHVRSLNVEQVAYELEPSARNTLTEVLLWNGIEMSQAVKNALFPAPVAEQAPVDSVVSVDPFASYTSATDWSDLAKAFDVEFSSQTSEEIHPFAKWMQRLSPPQDIAGKTYAWLIDNDNFNLLNRSILRQKDSDEASMNAQLAEKLKNVMEVSTKIMQENAQNNGWFGRLRNNFRDGVSTDTWADAFMDFQNHMLAMFAKINQQIERDRLWLTRADELVAKSSEVDAGWGQWLGKTAEQLERERTEQTTPSSEVKMQWNNRVEVLQSATVAHDHIQTANAVTAVLLEKVRQSTSIKEKLQQRSMMFYWSSLNMFAGLQSLQRNTNGIFEQAEMVEAMSQSFASMASRTIKEEMEQKQQIREAFKKMSTSQESMERFYKTVSDFQRDAVAIFGDLNTAREEMQEETVSVALSAQTIKTHRQKAKAKAVELEVPVSSASRGPR